jgi:hypothetical protein
MVGVAFESSFKPLELVIAKGGSGSSRFFIGCLIKNIF